MCIINHCKRVEDKINGETRETLNNNKDIEEIICFTLFQIGELAKNLSPEFKKNATTGCVFLENNRVLR